MADFFSLSEEDRREALLQAANTSGRPAHLLEKDCWVVWALRHLFAAPYAGQLVFKGGTSLSKAYGVIQRFSEDVDLTYDIRAIAADLIAEAGAELPASRSQQKKWTQQIRARLGEWVAKEVVEPLRAALLSQGMPASVRHEGERVFIDFNALASGSLYVASSVLLEFGARSTGEPCELRSVSCDAASELPGIVFPQAMPRVMRPERTFWEKATAIHVFCAQGQFRGGERFARHWHDLARLAATGYADTAIKDTALAHAVAEHKSAFFAENASHGEPIDYRAAVSGGLCLVPEAAALQALLMDYQAMVDDGLFLEDVETFSDLLAQCQQLQDKVNMACNRPC